LEDWADSPLGRLALILVLDQFSRHIHRGTPPCLRIGPPRAGTGARRDRGGNGYASVLRTTTLLLHAAHACRGSGTPAPEHGAVQPAQELCRTTPCLCTRSSERDRAVR